MSNKQIYPNCEGCNRCDYFVMKDECMDLKYGVGYKDDFYGQVNGLRNVKIEGCYTCSICGVLHPNEYACTDD